MTPRNAGYDLVDYEANMTDNIYEFYEGPQIVLMTALCLAIIIGNTCVLAAIKLSERGRKSRMNFFIMHLALADLLMGIMVALTELAARITVEWYAGNVMCKIIQFLQAVVTYSSTYMLVSLSIDRYNAVARPMTFSKSGYQGRVLVCTAWAISILFALPMLFIYQEIVTGGKRQCWLEFPAFWHWKLFITSLAVVTFFLPTIIIATCYIAIIYIIWSKGRDRGPCGSSQAFVLHQSGPCTPTRIALSDSPHITSRGIIPQAKVRTIKMTLIIVIVFILCWSPYFLYNILEIYEKVPYDDRISTLIQSAAPLNSAVNPIIYGVFSTRICKYLRRVPVPPCLRKLMCCCQESKMCRRKRFRGYVQHGGSQTTDNTLTTYEVHKLNDLKPSPVSQRDIRFIKNVAGRSSNAVPNGDEIRPLRVDLQEKQSAVAKVQEHGQDIEVRTENTDVTN